MFCKVDIDKCEDVAQAFKVTGVPQINVFHNGRQKAKIVNSKNKNSTYSFNKELTDQISEMKDIVYGDNMDVDGSIRKTVHNKVIHIKDLTSLLKHIKYNPAVVVNFWASWVPVCDDFNKQFEL